MFETSEQIHEYYLKRAKELSSKDKVILKTDADNEAFNSPVPGGIANNIPGLVIHIIEYDMNVINRARLKSGINIRSGDIRCLPYEDDKFDLILDLSTIDHIPQEELHKVLSEYRRVLKDNGKLLMFVWCGPLSTTGTWSSKNQYYFNCDILTTELNKHFDINIIQPVYHGCKAWPVPENSFLYEVEATCKF